MRNRTGRFDRLKAGTGHDGKSRAFAKGKEPTLSVHHDPNEARRGDLPGAPAHALGHRGHATGAVVDGQTIRAPGALDIQPRQGKPKAMHPVSLHNSVTARQITGAGRGGMGHSSAAVTDGGQVTTTAAAAPMADHYGGALPKSGTDAKVSWGNRDRADDKPHGVLTYREDTNARHDHNKALGRAILDEALSGTARRHGIDTTVIDTLPRKVK
jgi:hypothetical protein